MISEPRPNSLILSRGTVLDASWPGDFTGATAAQIVFYNNDQTVALTAAGTATDRNLSFLYTDVAALDAIPHGCPYEMFFTVGGRPYKHMFGTVVRREMTSFADVVTAIG